MLRGLAITVVRADDALGTHNLCMGRKDKKKGTAGFLFSTLSAFHPLHEEDNISPPLLLTLAIFAVVISY